MADAFTPLQMVKPEIGASRSTWGQKWNANLDTIDAKLREALAGNAAALDAAGLKLPLAGGVLSGDLRAPRFAVDDHAYLAVGGDNPFLNFAPNDYLYFDRARNLLALTIGAASKFSVSASDAALDVPLTLNIGAAQGAQATRKDYVDALAAGRLPLTGGALSGDLTVYRAGAPHTGAVFLGATGGAYVHFDGANYHMPNGQLHVAGGGRVFHTGNLDLNAYAPRANPDFGGIVRNHGGRIISVGQDGPSVAVHSVGGNVASGMLLNNANQFHFAQMDGNGSYIGHRMSLDGGNNLTVSGNVVAFSDERLKEGIRPVGADEAVAAVRGLRGAVARFRRVDSDRGREQVGVLAQRVAAALPEAVRDTGCVAGDVEGVLAVDDRPIVAALVGALNAALDRIEALEAKAGG